MPEEDLERIDHFAAEHGYTRSGFLLRAARAARVHLMFVVFVVFVIFGRNRNRIYASEGV